MSLLEYFQIEAITMRLVKPSVKTAGFFFFATIHIIAERLIGI